MQPPGGHGYQMQPGYPPGNAQGYGPPPQHPGGPPSQVPGRVEVKVSYGARLGGSVAAAAVLVRIGS